MAGPQDTGDTSRPAPAASPAGVVSGSGSADAAAREAWAAITRLLFGGELHRRFHAAADAAGLPHPGSLRALLSLDPDNPQSMRALAGALRCDASYITSLVDALERAGYVERQVSPADRRVKLVRVTASGRSARREAEQLFNAPPGAFALLSEDEIRTLADLLGKLIADMT